MPSWLILTVLALYFAALIVISYITSKNADTDAFFMANRNSPWYLVAFGMIGSSLSGVTFISVPGAVLNQGFSYFQMVIGYLAGYAFIAWVLMPLYYKLNLISIYTYFETRFGFWSYKTGAFFFLLSRTIGSSFRLYLAAQVLHIGIFQAWGVPFIVTGAVTIFLIWVYTFKGGIKTIIWTDSFQTIFLITALIVSVLLIKDSLNYSFDDLFASINNHSTSQIFFWNWKDDKFFVKQFISGAFIAIVMTGMDQDLMQKNLTCKNIKEAQINMCTFCIILVVVNFIFLCLGSLLYIYAESKQISLPARTDEVFPYLALNHFGILTGIFFLLGITASSYASADSALASLTTSFCIDFLDFKNKVEKLKNILKFWVHLGFSLLILLIIVVFQAINDQAVITAVFKVAGYTYGPLLGLFFFGLFTKYQVQDKYVPMVCVISPVLTYLINAYSLQLFGGYKFGFELLLINGAFTFAGLWILRRGK
ncbi:MAG: sodium:solute symporter [Cytophagales bacterium]|nr:sodium:solute symporter [Cytophagales bacterium]